MIKDWEPQYFYNIFRLDFSEKREGNGRKEGTGGGGGGEAQARKKVRRDRDVLYCRRIRGTVRGEGQVR
jgi:hypothetical protein